MKKLFFFKSNNGNNNKISPTSTEKADKHGPEDQVFGDSPRLRRSLSFSSGSLYDTRKGPRDYVDQNGSPCSTSYYLRKQPGRRSSSSRTLTPERPRSKFFDSTMVKNAHKSEFIPSRAQSDVSEISSYTAASNVSSKVLDRYIDGEQVVTNESKPIFSMKNQSENVVLTRPPRFLSTQSVPTYDTRKQKPKSQSFREINVPQSREWEDGSLCNESPRKLAKHVVERLSQSQLFPKMRTKEFDPDNPITIEDVYSRAQRRSPIDEVAAKNCSNDWCSETSDGSRHEEVSEFSERESLDRLGVPFDGVSVTDSDMELFKKFKAAEDRAAFLSEELGREKFLQARGVSVPVLIQTIRSLIEDKLNMAQEVSAVLHDSIAEKALFKKELKRARVDLDAQMRKLDKEKNELQLTLEKQLDRRSTEWSHKLEKYQLEEQRLRERVRELAEQNVCLQREVSSFSERQVDTKTKITTSEKQLEELSAQLKEARDENQYMQKNISELQEKFRAAEEDRDCFQRNYEEKVSECKDVHQAISRIQRTCTDQEKTIDGLRGLCEEFQNQNAPELSDSGLKKLHIEHMRLTGVEHALRKEIESCRAKVDSLRHENIDILNRLKGNGKDGTFKLDRELQNRISTLQSQVIPLLMDSSKLCRKLISHVKMNGFLPRKEQASDMGLDAKVFIECEVKLQGLERLAENLTISSQTMSTVLEQKSTMLVDESYQKYKHKPEDVLRSELKAEALLTSLLRDKLYSNEVEMDQLKAELAAAIRCNDILKCEIQNAMDNFSCVNHKTKDLELQMMKKDEIINRLQDDLQGCKKELAVVRGMVPKLTEDRDETWEKVMEYSEKNMLLESEVSELRRKMESLEEDILVKEGQITILKDSLGKPFDLLASPDSTDKFWKNAR